MFFYVFFIRKWDNSKDDLKYFNVLCAMTDERAEISIIWLCYNNNLRILTILQIVTLLKQEPTKFLLLNNICISISSSLTLRRHLITKCFVKIKHNINGISVNSGFPRISNNVNTSRQTRDVKNVLYAHNWYGASIRLGGKHSLRSRLI